MQFFLTVLHVMLSFSLILIILLQPGKDGASVLGGGGGGNQAYGPRGQAHLLSRATTLVAGLFMFTSITLAWYSTKSTQEGSNIEDTINALQSEEAKTTTAPTEAPVEAPAEAPAIPTEDEVPAPADTAPAPAGE